MPATGPSRVNFAHSDVESFAIPSKPERKPKVAEQKMQTEKIGLRNMRIQASNLKTIETQTADIFEQVEQGLIDLQPLTGTSNSASSTSTTWLVNQKANVSDEKLLHFLKKVLKPTLLELDSAEEEFPAFAHYEPKWEEEGEEAVRTVHLLKGPTEQGTNTAVLDLAWNATGNILAASYGQLDTLGWCEYSSYVHVWHVFQRGGPSAPSDTTSRERPPDVKIEVQGDVVSLAFHPRLPNILAGGSYNGEVILWDASQTSTDPQIAMSSIDDYFHREAIHEISWIEQGKKFLLATVSGDGRILLWDVADNLAFPSRGFTLLQRKRTVGGRALAFSPFDSSLFVVGSETGSLIRGMCPAVLADSTQISGERARQWKGSALRILDAVPVSSRMGIQHHVETFLQRQAATEKDQNITAALIFKSKPDPNLLFPQPKTTDLEPHSGPIVAARFSPFHRKMLLTAALDGGVKLFDILQQRPLYVLYPPLLTVGGGANRDLNLQQRASVGLADAAWSHARPLVFAVAPEQGSLVIYDLMKSKHEPVVAIPFEKTSERVTRVRFNPTQRGLLAAGGSKGLLKVFALPWSLSAPAKPAELQQMNRLMSRG
ncbi:unnamed protein product [Amoebophrya sp. A120]|nr:unnamed protein product [Amoebophrya sp. A120]|eukprot:GSA120T00020791001.1